jgi:hypothetical protein
MDGGLNIRHLDGFNRCGKRDRVFARPFVDRRCPGCRCAEFKKRRREFIDCAAFKVPLELFLVLDDCIRLITDGVGNERVVRSQRIGVSASGV